MRILITGGAGFIGSHLVEGLANDGHEIVVLDNFSTGRSENLVGRDIGFELIVGDLRDRDVVRKSLQGVEAVFHQAANASVPASIESPVESGSVNLQGSAILLEEARSASVQRVILASSSAVYGNTPVPLEETSQTTPLSPYGVQKLAVEHLARTISHSGGPDTVSLRYFNVYGPRQCAESAYAAAIPIFFRCVEEGVDLPIYGDGTQTRDFVHVHDVVEANRRVLLREQPWNGESFNVACGAPIAIDELAKQILLLTEQNQLKLQHCAPRSGDIQQSHASIANLQSTLGWSPRISLEEGLSNMITSRT